MYCAEYVNFLKAVTPDNQDDYLMQMRRFNLGAVGEADCPVFDCMFDYCATYSGGSVGGASLINDGEADIVLNWAGAQTSSQNRKIVTQSVGSVGGTA